MKDAQKITIGGKPYTINMTRRAAFRFGAYPNFKDERDPFRQLCIMLHCMITERVDFDAEEIADRLTDAEIETCGKAVAQLMGAAGEEAAVDPFSQSGLSAGAAAG